MVVMRAIVLLLIYNVYKLHVLALPSSLPIAVSKSTSTSRNCTEKYGSQPAQNTIAPQNLLAILTFCLNLVGSSKVLQFTDSYDNLRQACLVMTWSSRPLPLVVWLHPLFTSIAVVLTSLLLDSKIANLTGTIDGPLGFHLLLPIGRTTHHIYPIPGGDGLGWDYWYRNFDRSDRTLNVDVRAIDYFINETIHYQADSFYVDTSRIFLSGWSNGAAMAAEYALNTPGIAAAAVYSPGDPYRDYNDPCTQFPFATHFTPLRILQNRCDILNFCETGTAFIRDLNKRYPNGLIAEVVIIDIFGRITTTCNSLCSDKFPIGEIPHIIWPFLSTDKIFYDFFRKHKLDTT